VKRLAALLASLLAFAAHAESSVERGDYVVHYSAVPSIAIAPEVARQYAITRSANRALLNIAVLHRGQAATAKISGSATNLAGQRQQLALREVREGEAIYYLAEPGTADHETLAFELQVLPDGTQEAIVIRFRQEFFPPR
jgi:hypothetical protein